MTGTTPRELLSTLKVGDWISSDCRSWIRILAVVTENVATPLFAFSNESDPALGWLSLEELVEDNPVIGRPDFAGMSRIKPNDVLMVGCKVHGTNYVKVLARIGDAVLLSEAPDGNAHSMLKFLTDMEDHGLQIMPAGGREKLREAGSMTRAMTKTGRWVSTQWLALTGWSIVTEEHQHGDA